MFGEKMGAIENARDFKQCSKQEVGRQTWQFVGLGVEKIWRVLWMFGKVGDFPSSRFILRGFYAV